MEEKILAYLRIALFLGVSIVLAIWIIVLQVRVEDNSVAIAELMGRIESIDKFGGAALFEHRNLPIIKAHPIKEVCEICQSRNDH